MGSEMCIRDRPTHRVARRPRRTRRRREPKFHRDVSILFRPDDVAHRRQFGHSLPDRRFVKQICREGEADLMLFKQKHGQTNVTSLVERVSRFTVILKNPNKRTTPVMLCPAGDCAAICREGKDHKVD